MNGALLPKSALLCSYCCMRLIARTSLDESSPLRDRRHVAALRAGEELARPADFLVGIRDHLVPLRDPAHGPREHEDRGEEAHRDADCPLHDAGVEVDVR